MDARRQAAEQQLRAIEGTDKYSILRTFGHAFGVAIYLWRSLGLIFGVAVVVAFSALVGRAGLHLWPGLALDGVDYGALYLSEFVGVLAFGAITAAIGIWKFSFAETRLVSKASSLSDKFLDLAYRLEEEKGSETNGTIALKGIGEMLDRIALAPVDFRERLFEWIRSLSSEPENDRLPAAMLVACINMEIPVFDRRMWEAQVALALRFIIFAALVLLSYAILTPLMSNLIVAGLSLLTVVVALQATLRFISGSNAKSAPPR
jgi:hypothetical protein